MNAINGIARGALHVHLFNQVWPQRSEGCGRGTPANVACVECTQMHVHFWKKNSGLKNWLTYFSWT